ncbi:hypothetical protein LLQ46_23055 [Rouxiella badensis]|uniref:hypothetical protein n=1 Tax=Rouxiella badensis TaxID=1646377 RepID=UPI001B7A0DF4|nr:hypothetical protein [Rouxiella badensis]MCC3749741.1 hypothetical protein [Rouxiella badensis]
MAVNISYSQSFLNLMLTLSKDEVIAVGKFVAILKAGGHNSLPGRNKPSTGVSKNHVRRLQLIQYAIANELWHYHVGYQNYNQKNPFGDWTSSHVVHYQHLSSTSARFVHYSDHPPLKLPPKKTLI